MTESFPFMKPYIVVSSRKADAHSGSVVSKAWRQAEPCLCVPAFTPSLSSKGMCQPRKMGTVGAEPFSAKLRYTGADDAKHPNLIKVTVTMPHIDGTWELQAGLVPQMKCNATCVIFTFGAPLQPECRSCQVASNLLVEPRSRAAT